MENPANKRDMKKFGLIGNPIAHSKSPALFSAGYHLQGDCREEFRYDLIEAESCAAAMERFANEGYSGINVTSPFKEEVMSYVAHPDRVSTLLGAANVVINRPDGLYSYNTDYYGVYNTIAERLTNLKGEAVVIGGGGAGKAAALALSDLGMQTTLANRTPAKVAPFCSKIGVNCIELKEIAPAIERAKVVVYALMMPIEELQPNMLLSKILLEANYAHPNYSISPATEAPYRYIGGLEWLINQAIPAFKLFTSLTPDAKAMRELF